MVESIKEYAQTVSKSLDQGLETASSATRSGLRSATAVSQDVYVQGQQLYGQAKDVVDEALGVAQGYEAAFFSSLKGGLQYAVTNPAVSYPLAGSALLLALPFTRRFLWKHTLRHLRTDESQVQAAQQKIEVLTNKMEEYSKEARKLQERMAAAEEEWSRGRSKLRSTRQELQRLAATVGKSERLAEGVVADLRLVGSAIPSALQLRGDAASKVAVLRTERRGLERSVSRIVRLDP